MGVGSFPDPRPVVSPRGTPPPGLEGFDPQPLPPQAGEEGFLPVTVQDLFEQRKNRGDDEGAADFMTQFELWAFNLGVPPDPMDPELSRLFIQQSLATDEPTGGRTQFASEAELDFATAELRRQQAQTEANTRALIDEQAKTQAFERAEAKFDLLQVTDQLADARRKAATEALVSLLPFMVSPGQQFTPGFEPGGAGPQLGNLLGVNVPPQQLPTAEVPLNELANPPLAAPPEAIGAGLESLL